MHVVIWLSPVPPSAHFCGTVLFPPSSLLRYGGWKSWMVLELILAFIVELVLLQFFQWFFPPLLGFFPLGDVHGTHPTKFLVMLAPGSTIEAKMKQSTELQPVQKLVCSISAECSPGINSIHYFKHALQHYYILKYLNVCYLLSACIIVLINVLSCLVSRFIFF